MIIALFCVFNLSLFSLVKAELSSNQSFALEAFINALPALKTQYGWSPGSFDTACTWRGIKCDQNSENILALSFPNAPRSPLLEGWIPNQIGLLTFLEVLSLQRNRISGTIPSELFGLLKLREISLNENKLSGTIPNDLRCHSLQILNLANNELSGTIPSRFGTLSDLHKLDFGKNELSGVVPSLSSLSRLSELDLSFNRFIGLLGLPVSLETLNLSHTQLASLPDFQGFPRLKNMVLDQANNSCGPEEYFSEANQTCMPCYTPWRTEFASEIDSTNAWINDLIALDVPEATRLRFGAKTYNTCSKCSGGIRKFSRRRYVHSADTCTSTNLTLNHSCSFPCKESYQTRRLRPDKKLLNLMDELRKPIGDDNSTFLQLLLQEVFGNVSITIPKEQKIPRISAPIQNYSIYFNLANVSDLSLYQRIRQMVLSICLAITSDLIPLEPQPGNFTQIGVQIQKCQDDEYFSTQNRSCMSCFSDWKAVPAIRTFPGFDFPFEELELSPNDFASFQGYSYCSSCSDGTLKSSRELKIDVCSIHSPIKHKEEPCGYPCSAGFIDGAFARLNSILEELRKPLSRTTGNATFLSTLLSYSSIGPVSVVLPEQVSIQETPFLGIIMDVASIEIKLINCKTDRQYQKIRSLIHMLCSTISPGVELVSEDNFQYETIKLEVTIIQTKHIFIIVFFIAVVGVILLIGLYLWHFTSELRTLPDEVSWAFKLKNQSPWRWSYQGSKKLGAYFYQLERGSEDYRRVHKLFANGLRGSRFELTSITATYNPVLVTEFIKKKKVIDSLISSNPKLFETWTTHNEQRNWIEQTYTNKFSQMDWNQNLTSDFVPVVMMTDESIARLISQTGFSLFSHQEQGDYGKGFYFTSDAISSILSVTRPNPVMLLCWAIPGNIYPVVENPEGSESLRGKPIQQGYDSHFVLTSPDGSPAASPTEPQAPPATIGNGVFDQIVIGHENQVIPAFIIKFKPNNLRKLLKEFQIEATQKSAPTATLTARVQHVASLLGAEMERRDTVESPSIKLKLSSSTSSSEDHEANSDSTASTVLLETNNTGIQ